MILSWRFSLSTPRERARGANPSRTKIVPGGVDDSYGIAVAKLAGLPDQVVKRAKELLAEMEAQTAISTPKQTAQTGQISFAAMQQERAIATLQKTHLAELSDAECRELLADLTSMLS